jgi:hypothetical protein
LKIGTENRTKLFLAVGLGLIAVIVVGFELFDGSGSPAAANTSQPAAATEPSNRPTGRRIAKTGKSSAVSAPRLDPTLELKLLAETEDSKYAGSGRNIFVSQAETIPKPIRPVSPDQQRPKGPPPPPPPPPILLKFFGFASKPGEPKRIFLSQGEDVFIAGEGDIVDRRYRILHIGPASVEVEDVLNNNRQTIPLTQG